MKFLIIQIWDSHCHNGPSFNELAKITSKSTQEYCDFHGYDYLFLDKNADPTRQISWSRTFLINQKLQDYSWCWAIDADLLITNHTIKLENIIDDKYDVIVAANEDKIDRINTGSILWKNSDFSHNLIKKMYEDVEFANKGFWEQSCLIKEIQNNPSLLNNVKIVSPRLINSFYHFFFTNENNNHENGDFTLHCAGMDNDMRLEILSKMQEFIIKPIKDIQKIIPIWNK